MTHADMISVIVVTYNQEQTIGRTLDSILAQKCSRPVEIVIGEDCSTDGTRAVCRSYAERYPGVIRLICNAANKGLTDNYFDCIGACRGEYIADCAGDDFWTDPLKLEKEAAMLDGDSGMTLIHTAWDRYYEDTGETESSGSQAFSAPVTDGRTMLEAIVTQTSRPVIHLCTAMYRRSVAVEALRTTPQLFRGNGIGCEDLPLCFIMAAKGRIGYLPEVTLNYSCAHDSVSSNKDDRKQFAFVSKVTGQSHDLAELYGICTPATRKFFSGKLHDLCMHAFRAGDKALMDMTRSYRKDWDVRMNVKTRIIYIITGFRPLWRMALWARRLFLKTKKKRL